MRSQFPLICLYMISMTSFSPGERHVKRWLPTFSMTTILPLRVPVDDFNCTSQTMQDQAHKRRLTYLHTYIHTYILMIRFASTDNPHFPLDPMIGWLEEATMSKETRIWFCKKLESDHGPLSVMVIITEPSRSNQISSDLIRCRNPCATTSVKWTCVSHLCHDVDEWIAVTMLMNVCRPKIAQITTTSLRRYSMLRCRRRDNIIEMHLRLTSLPWCWWVDNRKLIRRSKAS